MTTNHSYKVTLRVRNEVGVLARISILLRKFRVNINSLDAAEIPEKKGFTEIHLNLETLKDGEEIRTVIKKLQRLIPVVESKYEKL